MYSKVNIALVSFVYPAEKIENFALECLISIKNQSNQNFDLFIFNDGYTNIKNLLSTLNLNSHVIDVSGTICEIRIEAIQRIADLGYEYIIFLDIDDLSELNRVEVVREKFSSGADIVVNELVLFGHNYNQPYNMLGGRLIENQRITSEMIGSGNCMGFSNTAFRVDLLAEGVPQYQDVIAFDWLLYSNLLLHGANAVFTSQTVTHYRQHEGNVATLKPTNANAVIRGLKVKIHHFKLLNNPDASELESTLKAITNNRELLDRYCDAIVIDNKRQIFWWESYKTLKEYKL